MGQKQAAEAIPYLRGATEKKPKEYRPRIYFADALLASGDFPKAEENYKAASEMDPKSAAAQLGLAHAQSRQKRLTEAAEHFRQAAALDASYKDGLLELAALLEANKQPDEAIAIYKEFPENAVAQERLGELLIEAKRYPEAIDRLENAIQKDPTPANALALAHAYRLNKTAGQGAAAARKGGRRGSQEFRAAHDLRKLATGPEEIQPGRPRILHGDAAETGFQGSLERAVRHADPAQRFPAGDGRARPGEGARRRNPAHYFFRAIMLDKTKQYKPALENYQKFLASAEGKYPDEEFQARQRVRIIQKELSKK